MEDERREVRRYGWYALRWWLAALAVIFVVGGGLLALNVATSGARGQGDGILQRNSASNWLDAQARFEENYADYEATVARIDVFHEQSLADPGDVVAKTNWLGSISYCTDLVASYNVDARSFLREDFRAADLPAQLDPATCTHTQENPS